jgi:hypothetical protein
MPINLNVVMEQIHQIAMNRKIHSVIKTNSATCIALLVIMTLFQMSVASANSSNDASVIDSGTRINTLEPIASQATGSLDINMSLLATGSQQFHDIILARGIMYNFTAESSGDATFDITLVYNITITDYVSQEVTSEYSDDILVAAGAPMWGTYNTWNALSISSRVTHGITVAAGIDRSFVLYLDTDYPQATIACTLIVILESTSNSLNNLLDIAWTTIPLSSPVMMVNYSTSTASHQAVIEPDSTSLLKFGTAGNSDLTEMVLNETAGTNITLTIIRWREDLSGNVKRSTSTGAGMLNDVYVPAYRNVKLDGSITPALVVNNAAINHARISWNFSAITDPTVNHQAIALQDQAVNFNLSKRNMAFRTIELTSARYFDIEFVGNPLETQIYWNVAVQFIAIGQDSYNLFTLNFRGDNDTEKATIFAANQNDQYTTRTSSFTFDVFTTFQYWFAGHGDLTPATIQQGGTQKLGMIITATASLAYLNFTCRIDVTERAIPNYVASEQMNVGTKNALPYDAFDFFHVRQFGFENYTQYKWGVQAINASNVIADAYLYCNDPVNNLYPRNLNNAITSTAFDTTGLAGTISLSFEITAEIQSNDHLYVYVKTHAGISPVLADIFGSVPTQARTITVTTYSSSQMQVIFNFTTNNMGAGALGPVIDNVKVWNNTHVAFLDDFQDNLSKWTQVDNGGGSDLYWHIASDATSFNRPSVSIVYPNNMYTMTGYLADPHAYTSYTKETYGYNPYIQEGNVSYIVVVADGNIVQNFTTIISKMSYAATEIVNGTRVQSNLTYSVLGVVTALPDFFSYYYIDLEPGFRYTLTIKMDGIDLKYLDAATLATNGTALLGSIDLYYGFFLINMSYSTLPETQDRMYLKFATVASGITFTMLLTKVSTAPEVPWLLIVVLASVGINGIFGAILAYNRRVLTLPKRGKKIKI